jgi:hypothetical protein
VFIFLFRKPKLDLFVNTVMNQQVRRWVAIVFTDLFKGFCSFNVQFADFLKEACAPVSWSLGTVSVA